MSGRLPFSEWDPVSQTALVWSKQLLSASALTEPPPSNLWYQASSNDTLIRAALSRHRIIPPAAAWLSKNSHASIPAESQKWLAAERVINQRQVITHVAAAARIQQALLDTGVRALFIKGPFQGKQATGDAAGRGSGDIDVFVDPEKFEQAVEALVSAGAIMKSKHLTPDLAKKVALAHHEAALEISGIPIDVHRRLDPNPDRMQVEFDTLWRERDTVHLAGVDFPTLSPIDACVLVASHGCRDNWLQIRQLIDFAQSMDRVQSDGVDLKDLEQRAKEQAVTRRLAVALAVAQIVIPELPTQSSSAQFFARWAWTRYRSGRVDVGARTPRNAMARFAYSTLTEEGFQSAIYAARRLTWVTSTNVDPLIPHQPMWAYPLLAPVNVVRRMVETKKALRNSASPNRNSVDFAVRERLLLMIGMDTHPIGAKEAWEQWRKLVPDLDGVTATEVSLLPMAWRNAMAAGAVDSASGRLQGLQRRAAVNATAAIAEAARVQESLLRHGIRSQLTGGAAAALAYPHLSRWPLLRAELWIDRKDRDAALAPNKASVSERIIGRHQVRVEATSGHSTPTTLTWRHPDLLLEKSQFHDTKMVQWQGRKLLIAPPAITAMHILVRALPASRPGGSATLLALFDIHLLAQDPSFNRNLFTQLLRNSKLYGVIQSRIRPYIDVLPQDLIKLLTDSTTVDVRSQWFTRRRSRQMQQDFLALILPRAIRIVIRTLS